MKNGHGGVTLFKKLQANTPLWLFFTLLVLLLIMRNQLAYFLNGMNCLKSRKASVR